MTLMMSDDSHSVVRAAPRYSRLVFAYFHGAMTTQGYCPRCHQTSSEYGLTVPQYSCWKCKTKYCKKCGPPCPSCGNSERTHYDDFTKPK